MLFLAIGIKEMARFLTAVFILYLIFVAAISVSTAYQTFFAVMIVLSFIVLSVYISLKRNKSCSKIKVGNDIITAASPSSPRYMPAIYFLIVLLFSVVYWLGDYPGGFNLDAYGQWMQAHGRMQYNDWHPFVSTLLIQLVLWIQDSFVFYIAVQIILFSIAVSYLLCCLQSLGIKHEFLVGVAFYIGFNPAIGLNTISMTKDAQFTILIVLLTGVFIRIISTRGEWLKNTIHLVWLSILTIGALLVRHNGILFVIPAFLLLILLFKTTRCRIILSCLSVVFVTIIIKWPIASMLNVEKHDNVLGEAVGVPMAMMANALITDEENFPEEVHNFLITIADDNAWKENYNTGEWDSCKWLFGGISLLKDCTISEIQDYTISTIQNCPQACYESFRENTRMVWSLFATSASWVPNVYIEKNEFNIHYSPISPFYEISAFLKSLSLFPLISFIFWNYGFLFAALLIIWLLGAKSAKDRSLLLVLPQFFYSIGTMLLLSGPSQRYYSFGMVLIPPIALTLLFLGKKEKLE